ncbi:hypothetical protein MUK70_21300 [Dyadobacter chenwenxiniae]|uniref:Uncharacterized protein n=1 Tax=Dyadobacter chenwenxiniae TaxID=2906456 RepID=A0A9X1TER0_9BACT|nr:hypothetical protein [Dyadobacter chenwenxiniae]MCF0061780.1 hypothetical protein [Dyadobacter chenwenxiniae]UON81597.1 hypothetical protein MUK70_21300 [Dyadobacter chenwenxiniae]
MNKIFLSAIAIFLLALGHSNAQLLQDSHGDPCVNCVPSGWTISAYQPSISNIKYLGGNTSAGTTWNPAILPPPTFEACLDPLANGFLTIMANYLGAAVAQTTISNLTPGRKYKIHYNVISLRVGNLGFGTQAKLGLVSGGSGINVTKFQPGGGPGFGNVSTWIPQVLEFTATGTTAVVAFSGEGGQLTGYLGLDIGHSAISACDAGLSQVALIQPINKGTNKCPEATVNLNDFVVAGTPPCPSCVVVWQQSQYHSEPLNLTDAHIAAAGDGQYFAFWYDKHNSCFNTDLSTSLVTVQISDCPDLSPSLDINAIVVTEASKDFVVNLFENSGVPTSGAVTFRINKVGGFKITYPTVSGVSDVFQGGTPNQNSNWTFSENASYITASSTTPIPAKGKAVVGFTIKPNEGVTPGTGQNIKATLIGKTGGDKDSRNNAIVTSISTN